MQPLQGRLQIITGACGSWPLPLFDARFARLLSILQYLWTLQAFPAAGAAQLPLYLLLLYMSLPVLIIIIITTSCLYTILRDQKAKILSVLVLWYLRALVQIKLVKSICTNSKSMSYLMRGYLMVT